MKIREIDIFDLYGDGTMVIKTNMEEGAENLRYAWYVMQGRKILDKILYQRQPFTVWQIPEHGTYLVKAFVKNAEGEKIREESVFVSDRQTSPELGVKRMRLLTEAPLVENISGPFYRMYIPQDFPDNTLFAWYIYQEDVREPLVKQMYSDSPEYTYAFENPGTYSVKLFVLLDGSKDSAVSSAFTVE